MDRIFLLSPAHTGGRRAELIFNPRATFPLALALRRGEALPLGEIFRFLSGLYFRGKLAYATTFAAKGGAFIITSNRGLLPVHTPATLDDLRRFRTVPIAADERRYLAPLRQTARRLAAAGSGEVVLLGSISTPKYVEPLLAVFGERLLFPTDFVGRGDMSRGGLLLRCVRDARELAYQPVLGAIRRGVRPPRLTPASWRGTPWSE